MISGNGWFEQFDLIRFVCRFYINLPERQIVEGKLHPWLINWYLFAPFSQSASVARLADVDYICQQEVKGCLWAKWNPTEGSLMTGWTKDSFCLFDFTGKAVFCGSTPQFTGGPPNLDTSAAPPSRFSIVEQEERAAKLWVIPAKGDEKHFLIEVINDFAIQVYILLFIPITVRNSSFIYIRQYCPLFQMYYFTISQVSSVTLIGTSSCVLARLPGYAVYLNTMAVCPGTKQLYVVVRHQRKYIKNVFIVF